ncbi:flagellar basal body-associated protein FliL [Herbaspirillum sp. RTI4]|uniref:flagellar basal body-associated protein FliL n=1 Tax=Herbaspirillum sp. RTI4 TaxID=3048640 RepID=UPI002AB5CABE|nr:flagellar basal body-associated protein FliL [Herbaspirillum sp. RTI4]MDY7578313.1 flagellar basal body-associated protein FliL [Herbaspirillum sp. RTI4]MEA9981194.1 flagellar basal body-associated protein FliL [Herbaspirillum sp. RTI4]
MATSPKAKTASKGGEGDDAAPKKSSKKLLFIIIGLVVVLAGGGAAAFMMMGSGKDKKEGAEEHASEKKGESQAPVFAVIEPFVVNLQQENGDQFLQVAITLQVATAEGSEMLKTFMPQVRSRLLMVLSSKKASDILTNEGKEKLTEDILDVLNKPFAGATKGPGINDVFYTSFVVQQQ